MAERLGQANGLADHVRISLSVFRPKTISEYHNAGGVGALVFRADEPPEDGMRPITSKYLPLTTPP